MTDIICPESIVRASEQTSGNFTNTTLLISSFNTANLKSIVWDVHSPLLLRLLHCKEEKSKNNQNKCPFTDPPYTEHINKEATKKACIDSKNKLAQIYFRHEQFDIKARSCVVAFIESYNLHKIDLLLDLFYNTVEWLNIAKECPYFYIVHFDLPLFGNELIRINKKLDENLKQKYTGYLKDEKISFITNANKYSEFLKIICTTKFSMKTTQSN